MRTEYFLIPEPEVTQRIVNLSTSRRREHMPVVIELGLILNTHYRVVEAQFEDFPHDLLNYEPYTADELRQELATSRWKQPES